MSFYAQQPEKFYRQLLETKPTEINKQATRLTQFLESNGFKPYVIQRDGLITEFSSEEDLNFFLLNFPSFKRI